MNNKKNEERKTKRQLMDELESCRRRISELEKAEMEQNGIRQALEESEECLRLLANNMTDLIILVDQHGNYQYVSPSLQTVLGYTSDELRGKLRFENVHPEDMPIVQDSIMKSIKTHSSVKAEYRYKHGGGEYVWIETVGKTIFDKDGNFTRGVLCSRDITARKKAEEALIVSEEKYRNLVENINEVIYEADEEGIVTYISHSKDLLRGYTPSDIIGRPFSEFIYCEDLPRIVEMYHRLLSGPVPLSEYRIILKSGELLWVQSSSRAIFDGDRFKGFRGTMTDITERKQAEEDRRILEERLIRAEKMEAIGTLAGGVAHDLNNVLGGIVGYSELLFMKIPEWNPLKRYASNILKSAQRAAAMINDLLTLGRRGVLVSEVVNLNSVILDYFDTPEFEKLKAYHPHVTFKTDFQEDLSNLKGSPFHLEKTVMNLLSNAAEALSDGGEVMIRTENRYLAQPIRGYDDIREGDYVVFTVSDTGKGMSGEELKRIFEPFYTKKVMGRSGTGLGLTVVWGTVKDHKGYIDVQSREGQGSAFSLYFPVTGEKLIEVQKRVPPEQYMGREELILVVDDVEGQRDIAVNMLSELGYKVHAVPSGEEAVKFLKEEKVDLLVLDMIMEPGIDGLETFQRALKINPQQKAILVSGFSKTDQVREAQKLGAGAYVQKPYLLEKIGLAIRCELE